jgi:hypothetical protein
MAPTGTLAYFQADNRTREEAPANGARPVGGRHAIFMMCAKEAKLFALHWNQITLLRF